MADLLLPPPAPPPPAADWVIDLKSGKGKCYPGKVKKADITITIQDQDMVDLASGKLNPQQAFMKGKLKIKGNMGLAMKLGTVIDSARPK